MSLVLEHVSIALQGKNLVKDISLDISPGEIVGLLGPNGAGKTTTFNLLIGQLYPDSGDVILNESVVTKMSMPYRARLGVAYLPQEPSVFRNLSVKENLDIALSQSFSNPARLRIRREQLINEFNLSSFSDRTGYKLSGGERRRCEVARALAIGRKGPKYLLLDEPFAGVDPMAVIDLQNLIQQLRMTGMGVLITDHNVRETLAITDRSYILSNGTILASGTSSQISKNPLVKTHYLGEGFEL